MQEETEDYRPPTPPTGDHPLAVRALVVSFQQLPDFRPYALELPVSEPLGRRTLDEARRAVHRLAAEDPAISREHARFVSSKGGHVEVHCLSAKGMGVNGWAMRQGECATLFGGEVLRLGGTLLVYRSALPVARREDLRPDADIVTTKGVLAGPYGLRELRRQLASVERAKPRVVLVHGETGTGKESLAHEVAARLGVKPPITVNIAAIPRDQVTAELFGVAAGAFTGVQARPGVVRDAARKKAAVFLDEIGDMPVEAQAGLLRVLQDGSVQVLGAGEERPGPVPFLLATHRDLDTLVATNAFRADLLARIQLRVALPALRERPEDVFSIFLQLWGDTREVDTARIPVDAVEAMMLAWHEDNVRGLGRLALEAAGHPSRRLALEAGTVKRVLRNGGDHWWRAAVCPAAARAALASGSRKKEGSPASQVDAVAWLNRRAVGHTISEGTFKRLCQELKG